MKNIDAKMRNVSSALCIVPEVIYTYQAIDGYPYCFFSPPEMSGKFRASLLT